MERFVPTTHVNGVSAHGEHDSGMLLEDLEEGGKIHALPPDHEYPKTSQSVVYNDHNTSWASNGNEFMFPSFQSPGHMFPALTGLLNVCNPADFDVLSMNQVHYMTDPTLSLLDLNIASEIDQNHVVAPHPAAIPLTGAKPSQINSSQTTEVQLDTFAHGQEPAPSSSTETSIKCDWPGCRTKRTFTRKYEYQRHMKKHTRSTSIPCPVIYCPRKGSRSFYRWDKLFDHLRTGHTEDETSECLVDGCNSPQMPLNMLRLHAHHHYIHHYMYPNLEASADFLKAFRSFPMARKCELKKCKRWFSSNDATSIQQHLLQHPIADRRAQVDIIKKMGYDAISANIICPVCEQQFTRFAQFLLHLENDHLVTDPVHWLSFKGDITPDDKKITQYVWRGWECKDGGSEECYCRHCGDRASSGNNTWIDHHLRLVSLSDDVKAAKASILRLIPAFGDHPVFNSIISLIHRGKRLLE